MMHENLHIRGNPSVAGKLAVEAPAHLNHTAFHHDCSVGAFTYFNHGCEAQLAKIGRYCSIGQGVIIGPGEHRLDMVTTHPVGADPSGVSSGMAGDELFEACAANQMARFGAGPKVTIIGHDVWIGARAIVLAGVTIATGAVLGAGAVVTKDVQPYEKVAGNPAHHIGFRFGDDERLRARLLASAWWDYDLSFMARRDFSDPLRFLDDLDAAIAAGMPKREPLTVTFGAP